MKGDEKDEQEKTTSEEGVNLKISKQVLDFADFYATIASTDRDTLLAKLLTERLEEVKEQFKNIPHLKIPELF